MKGQKTVKNVRGTSSRTTSSGNSWNSKLTDKNQCSVSRCSNKGSAGAHVTYSNTSSKKEYIVSMCKTHNHFSNTSDMKIRKDSHIVRALKHKF